MLKAFMNVRSEEYSEEVNKVEMIRSFMAFDIDNDGVRKELAAIQSVLLRTGADLKLVETENIHVTVRFLGDISASMVEKVFEVMKTAQFAPFSIKIQGLGVFPNTQYAKVVWAGMTEGSDQLKSIFNQLELRLHNLGFTPDSRGFSPHLTIARVRSGRNKDALSRIISENVSHSFGAVKAACLRLKRSDLTPKGPIYSTLKEFCP